jgi:hypothetical protein
LKSELIFVVYAPAALKPGARKSSGVNREFVPTPFQPSASS